MDNFQLNRTTVVVVVTSLILGLVLGAIFINHLPFVTSEIFTNQNEKDNARFLQIELDAANQRTRIDGIQTNQITTSIDTIKALGDMKLDNEKAFADLKVQLAALRTQVDDIHKTTNHGR